MLNYGIGVPGVFRRHALASSIASALFFTFYNATAQAQSEDLVEEVVVVGSQIRGARITEAVPVSVVGSEAIAASGAVSGDELFRSIPEAGDITFNGTYLGGANSNAARGDVSTVSLRGLAQGNTLLLLNGRRLVVHPTSQTDNETPVFGYNVNALPVSGLERVEILKDGAAALYGSDAVAGVVNNVLRSDFEGLEVDVQFGEAEYQETTANMIWGSDFAQGAGNASVFLGMTDKGAIVASDHEYTATLDRRDLMVGTSFEDNVVFDQRSTTSAWGGFQALGVNSAIRSNGVALTDAGGNFVVQPRALSGCGYNISTDLCYASGAITTNARRPLRSDARLIPEFSVLPSTERFNMFSFVNYDFSSTLSFFGEVGYYKAETDAISSPPSSLASTPIVIPATAYWNPLGPVGSPNRLPGLNIPESGLPIQIRNYGFTDFGPRRVWVDNDQARILGGLRGDAFGWSWESALLYNEATVTDQQDHASTSLTQLAMARTTPDAYNPFQGGNLAFYPDPLPASNNVASTIDSFRIVAVRENTTSLGLWDFKVSKPDLVSLWAGDVGVASGIEYRKEKYEDNRDARQDTSSPYTDIVTGNVYGSDLMGHSPSRDVTGERSVVSAFLEFAIPLVSEDMNVPLVQAMEMQVAGRYEDYDDVGSVARPKVAVAWDVIDGVRLRGSVSEGFKAPNLDVLNTPVLERLNGRVDYVKCEADLRAGRIADFSRCTQSYGVPGLRQGNPNLVPEESESQSYGLVFEPTFLPSGFGDLTFTVDSWTIKQTGIVGVLDEQSAISLDYLYRLQGSSNPFVVRADPTSAEVAAFAGSGLAPAGEVLYVDSAFTNLLPLEISGVDLGIVYDNNFGSLGDLTLSLNVSKLRDFFQEPDPQRQILINASNAGELNPGVPVVGVANLIGENGNPELRWTLNATWSNGPVQVGFMTQYLDDVRQPSVLDANRNPWLVDSLQTYNLYAQYAFQDWSAGSTTVRLGGRNVTDEDPPLAQGGYLGNIHQPVGRYWYLSVKHAF